MIDTPSLLARTVLSVACLRHWGFATALLAAALLPVAAGAAPPASKHRTAHRTYRRAHHFRHYRRRRLARRPAAPRLPATVVTSGPPVISTGQQADLHRFLQPETVTLFIFTNSTSTMEQAFVKTIQEHVGSRGGVRLIRIASTTLPVAKQYGVTLTPTVIVYDRRGKEAGRATELDDVAAATVTAMRLARIDWVDERDPKAPEVYKMMGRGKQPVPGILKTMSLRPDLLELIMQLSGKAHFSDGFLPRKTKEMVATYVSAINHCKF